MENTEHTDDSTKPRAMEGLAGTVQALEDCHDPQVAAHLLDRFFDRVEALGDALLVELLLARWEYSWGGVSMFEEAKAAMDRPHILQLRHPDHDHPIPACKACLEEAWEKAKDDEARDAILIDLLDHEGPFMSPMEANVSLGSPHIERSDRVQGQERGWGEEEEFFCEHVLAECPLCASERYVACQTYLTHDPETFTTWDIQITRDAEGKPTITRAITAPDSAPRAGEAS